MKRTAAAVSGVGPHNTIQVHVRETAQLFDSLDPFPFYERDLDPDAEEYIVASLRELGTGKPCTLIIHVDEKGTDVDADAAQRAVHAHFARRAALERRDLRRLLRRGWISIAIGLSFLALLLFASEMVVGFIGAGTFARLLQESLIIGGWVAMWRPLEIFLYEWWPHVGRARTFERLAQIAVRVEDAGAAQQGSAARVEQPRTAT